IRYRAVGEFGQNALQGRGPLLRLEMVGPVTFVEKEQIHFSYRYGVNTRLDVFPHIEGRALPIGRATHDGSPTCLTGVAWFRRIRKCLLADARIHAISANHQVVAPRGTI